MVPPPSRPGTASLIVAAREVNTNRESTTARRVGEELDGVENPVIVLAGAAYKPDVSDVRESPALNIAELLRSTGIDVRIYDPLVGIYASPLIEKAAGADLVAVLVPHRDLTTEIEADRVDIEAAMRRPRIVDFSSGSPRPT